ncbi:hypothetical protein GCM10010252_44540 [Streptomyces aureoverticillatus]|nr:hypothetical protein GCM10010252_44540 [Streptomyces aureoverticillatus]
MVGDAAGPAGPAVPDGSDESDEESEYDELPVPVVALTDSMNRASTSPANSVNKGPERFIRAPRGARPASPCKPTRTPASRGARRLCASDAGGPRAGCSEWRGASLRVTLAGSGALPLNQRL